MTCSWDQNYTIEDTYEKIMKQNSQSSKIKKQETK
jgi:hypothetical protein